MNSTPFPTTPVEVAMLTAAEFAFEQEWNDAPSLDEVCRRFGSDVNRALVWFIRFRALKAWCARDGVVQWLDAGSRTLVDVCDAAAGFTLNDQWEFDTEAFRLAVDVSARQRAGRFIMLEPTPRSSVRSCTHE